MAQRVFDIFHWEVQPASPSLESGLFKQLIDEADSDPSSAGHGSYHVGCFPFLHSVVAQGVHSFELLTDRWVLKSPVTTEFAYQSLQLYQFLPHVFWHFIVRYIDFKNFCVFFRKLTSLSLWNAPLYPWWSFRIIRSVCLVWNEYH